MHKYLGIAIRGDLTHRGKSNLSHRLQCAWMKFHQYKESLSNKHVPVSLRLRLFDATVTPSLLYGLATAPLTARDMERFGVVQRKMLRTIAGVVSLLNDDWPDFHRRQNPKMAKALQQHPVKCWETRLRARKLALQAQLASGDRCPLAVRAHAWHPLATRDDARRSRGHPRMRWLD